jgi:hypothetical protein
LTHPQHQLRPCAVKTRSALMISQTSWSRVSMELRIKLSAWPRMDFQSMGPIRLRGTNSTAAYSISAMAASWVRTGLHTLTLLRQPSPTHWAALAQVT